MTEKQLEKCYYGVAMSVIIYHGFIDLFNHPTSRHRIWLAVMGLIETSAMKQ